MSITNCPQTNIAFSDCADLVNIYNLSNGNNWNLNDGWGTEANGNLWSGITLHPNGEVRVINLPFNNMNGQLPPTLNGLNRLEVLNLNFNLLGDQLPPDLADMAQLRELRLSRNDFNGDINDNNEFPDWLSTISSLQVLEIQDHRFAGQFPDNIGALVNLRELRIDNFNPAPFPDLRQLQQLEILDLSSSLLVGSIPNWIGELGSLEVLDLQDSNLSGVLPESLTELEHLRELRLGFNALSGRLPINLGDLTALQVLSIPSSPFNGRFLSGPLPDSLTQLTQLVELNLFWQGISGPLPINLGAMGALRELNLVGNELTDSLPSSVTQLQLNEFFISANFFASDETLQLQLSPAQSSWYSTLAETVYLWPEIGPVLGVFDSLDQRESPILFRDRFH
ncbi:MAG: hypothetical protein AAGJ52_01370 [Pseudomonadota bacterium]